MTGGVISGLGKGVVTASLANLIQAQGFNVSIVKIDPYLNVDAGTMRPTEHGEVFVTADGGETDQDIGTYERFLGKDLSKRHNITTGQVYLSVIGKERNLEFDGKCVEVIPHIPQEVQRRLMQVAKEDDADFVLVEIGGTVGEYENILFLEAARMMKLDNPDDVVFVLVSFLPVPSHLGEMKTKPTQHAARALNNNGIQPDFIVARGAQALDKPRRQKLAFFCWLRSENDVIAAPDVPSIYEIPLVLEGQNFGDLIMKRLKIRKIKQPDKEWDNFVEKMKKADKKIRFAVVGKYFSTGSYTLADSYISVIHAVKHAAWHNGVDPELVWIDSEDFEKNPEKVGGLKNYDALIVPGGFGTRGIEGIIKSIKFARENKMPYLGLCYGMQLATIEFARNVLGYKDAHTVECDPKSKHLIININPHQAENIKHGRYGGTMRLGSYDCVLSDASKALKLYGKKEISERHRHRYEFNNDYRAEMEKRGMLVAGINPKSNLVEIIELKDHPYFVATQFHPEFKSRFLNPHPLFVGLVRAVLKK